MSISKLSKVLAPPSTPSDPGLRDEWPLIDEAIAFPSDYIDFIRIYGTGKIANFIIIFNPFSELNELNFFEQKKLIVEDFNELVESDVGYYKYNLYPSKNGLIPVGVTDNGDYIFWVMSSKNNSDAWGTAIIAARSPDVEYFEYNLTSLLEGILLRKIKAESFPSDFPFDVINFECM